MCSPVLNLPSYKEPPECIPCYPVQGLRCLPCGTDPVTLRRPLIVGDSTFDYRPTSWPGMILNSQDKKVRYQLINYERPECLSHSSIVTYLSEATVTRKKFKLHNIQFLHLKKEKLYSILNHKLKCDFFRERIFRDILADYCET